MSFDQLDNYQCQPNTGQVKFIEGNINLDHCKTKCMGDKECTMFSFNNVWENSYSCSLYSNPCDIVLKPNKLIRKRVDLPDNDYKIIHFNLNSKIFRKKGVSFPKPQSELPPSQTGLMNEAKSNAEMIAVMKQRLQIAEM